MLIRDALFEAEQILHTVEAEILLANALGVSREWIFAHPEAKIQNGNFKTFSAKCALAARGKPVAYLTHHKEFFGMDFYIDERVLIPRPETEILVEEIIFRYQKSKVGSQISICDIGTGSGCIAIALAKALPSAKITAVDISKGALDIAAKNAKTHKVKGRIKFIKSDLMEKISNKNFNFMVANLPYVSDDEILGYEPKIALSGGKTGLELFEKLFKQLSNLKSFDRLRMTLPNTSCLICEIGFGQRKAVQKLIKRYFGGIEVEWKKDLAGIYRIFVLNF